METITAEGTIPHLRIQTAAGEILAPVKLQPNKNGRLLAYGPDGNRVLPRPMRRDGRLVYALPGGGEVLA